MDPRLWHDLGLFAPEIILTVALLVLVVVDVARPAARRITFGIAAAGLAAAFLATLRLADAGETNLFFDMVALDHQAVFFKGFLIAASFIVLLAAPGSRELARAQLGELYMLLLGVTLGMLLLASSIDLLMIYLSLEMVSVASYIMVGYLRNQRQSNEASLKYILFGAVSTGSMLYGITLLFGLTGTTKLAGIQKALAAGAGSGGNALTLLVATTLILAGFGFKTAAVPFHFWCPDVYTGAPTPVTAFLSVAPKAAGFATLVRFFYGGLSDIGVSPPWSASSPVNWSWLLLMVSVVTMTLGNIAALRQENLKRLLAYSSIAHAGYMLMGAVVVTPDGLQAILVYLVTYLFMNLGAFLIVIEIYNRTGSFEMSAYRGLLGRSPFLTIAMTTFLLSLMGIPPLAGFFGKLYVFGAAVARNLAWFAAIGALNSVIAVYYYARIIKTMIIDPAEDRSAIRIPWAAAALVWLMLIPTVAISLVWNQIQRLTSGSWRLFVSS